MPQVFARITIKQRWWVRPYLWALRSFVATFGWAADPDDLSAWIEREADWIARRGLVVRVE